MRRRRRSRQQPRSWLTCLWWRQPHHLGFWLRASRLTSVSFYVVAAQEPHVFYYISTDKSGRDGFPGVYSSRRAVLSAVLNLFSVGVFFSWFFLLLLLFFLSFSFLVMGYTRLLPWASRPTWVQDSQQLSLLPYCSVRAHVRVCMCVYANHPGNQGGFSFSFLVKKDLSSSLCRIDFPHNLPYRWPPPWSSLNVRPSVHYSGSCCGGRSVPLPARPLICSLNLESWGKKYFNANLRLKMISLSRLGIGKKGKWWKRFSRNAPLLQNAMFTHYFRLIRDSSRFHGIT